MPSANSTQVGGAHYKSSLQHWDYVAAHGLGYFEGQVTKYATRWRYKNGLQDLDKAAHFLDKLIELALEQRATPVQTCDRKLTPMAGLPSVSEYAAANKLIQSEAEVIRLLTCWAGELALLTQARRLLSEMRENALAEAEGGPGAGYVNQDR